MKKLISIGASLMLAVSVFATGNQGVNPPQSGVFTVTNGVQSVTNTFAYPFQTAPLLVVYCNATNGTPITNNFVTTTNFSISFPAAGTNDAYSWQAFVGGTRMQSGIIGPGATSGATTWTNAFTYPYASTPSVIAIGSVLPSATNSGVAVTATTTNFIVSSGNTNQTIYWQAVGTVYNPPSDYTGQYPRNNTVNY